MSNLGDLLERGLDAAQKLVVRDVAVASAELGFPLYLVGGTVRDVILKVPVSDLDLVVVGGGGDVAFRLSERLGGRVAASSQFGTAKLIVRGTSIDLVMARGETYAKPGMLPDVVPGGIQDDLARRDFSINAMAVSLGDRYGDLLDPFGGRSDVELQTIRVLHVGSFVDDATRILRAVRYAARYGFQLEVETARLLQRDLAHLGAISGDRIRNELERYFMEPDPGRALCLAQNMGVLRSVHPEIVVLERAISTLSYNSFVTLLPRHLVVLALLAYSTDDVLGIVDRLGLVGPRASAVSQVPCVRARYDDLESESISGSRIADMMDPLDDAAIEACSLVLSDGVVRNRLSLYLNELRHVSPALDGRDLLALGVPMGPQVGEMLRRLRTGRLDGLLSTSEEETRFVADVLCRGHLS